MGKHLIRVMLFFRWVILRTKIAIYKSETEDGLCEDAEKIITDINRYQKLCNEQAEKAREQVRDMVDCYIDAYGGYN